MRKLVLVGTIIALTVTWTGAAQATPPNVTSTTEVIAGNPTCGGVKIEAENITVGQTYGPITITAYDGTYVSWTSVEGVGEVIVKGGPNALVYHYSPPATGDTGLHAPLNPNNGKYYGISHIEFCRFAKK